MKNSRIDRHLSVVMVAAEVKPQGMAENVVTVTGTPTDQIHMVVVAMEAIATLLLLIWQEES